MKTIGKFIACSALVALVLGLYGCPPTTIATITDEAGFVYVLNRAGTAYSVYLQELVDQETIIVPGEYAELPVTAVGAYVYGGPCENVVTKNVTLPEGIKTITAATFSGWQALETITIPDSVTTIETAAFSDCDALVEITLPDGLVSLANNLFMDSVNLTTIRLGDHVKTVSESAFLGCDGLLTIEIPETNPYLRFENGALFDKNRKVLILHAAGGFDATFTVPNGVTTIETNAFNDQDDLRIVVLPEGLLRIGDGAFRDCDALLSLTIPDSVTEIGNH
ncbi:MAG: leucine-rich repeat domain-containing protein, partial [Bacillota bacterium]|nr:leucine-rich repeat domain-containing protein [Bacillota bacterium]